MLWQRKRTRARSGVMSNRTTTWPASAVAAPAFSICAAANPTDSSQHDHIRQVSWMAREPATGGPLPPPPAVSDGQLLLQSSKCAGAYIIFYIHGSQIALFFWAASMRHTAVLPCHCRSPPPPPTARLIGAHAGSC